MNLQITRAGRSSAAPLVALLAGAWLGIGPQSAALALPAPLSETQLTEQSQLVVLADVLGVACTGASPTGHPRFAAWLQVVASPKGGTSPGSTLLLAWSGVDLEPIGAWEARVYPGDRVRLYLVAADEAGAWKVFHPRGAVVVTRAPAEGRRLPERPGEVRFRATGPAKPTTETLPGPQAPPSSGAPPAPQPSKPQASNRFPFPRTTGRPSMDATRRTMLQAALILGLSVPLPALARQDQPRPAPAADATSNQAGKPLVSGSTTRLPDTSISDALTAFSSMTWPSKTCVALASTRASRMAKQRSKLS